MSPDLDRLIKLQHLETTIAEARAAIAAHPQRLATAQTELGAVEEKVIERMVEDDGITAEVKKAEAALATQQKEIEVEKKDLAQDLTQEEATLAKASEARAALVKDLDPRLMSLF